MSKSSFLSGNFSPLERSVTLAKMATGTDGNLITYDASGNPAYVATGSSGQVLTSAGAGSPPTFSALTTGKVLQVVNVDNSTASTSTTVIPDDLTIPQNTEGKEIMTLAITPGNSSNKLFIDVSINGVDSSGSLDMNGALFQDSTANALTACNEWIAGGTGTDLAMKHYMTAGTTSETTFKVRVGPGTSGTMTYNGRNSGDSLFGGVMKSTMTIWEISA